jgi:hypothetical protein
MPISKDNYYFDFEELFFEKNCNIDEIIYNFFSKYNNDIKGDKEYITYKIKKTIIDDRNLLTRLNNNLNNNINNNFKKSFIKHYVIPDKNNGKEYYIYAINTFI